MWVATKQLLALKSNSNNITLMSQLKLILEEMSRKLSPK